MVGDSIERKNEPIYKLINLETDVVEAEASMLCDMVTLYQHCEDGLKNLHKSGFFEDKPTLKLIN